MRTPSFCELSVRVFKGLIHLTDYEKWMTFSHILSCVRNDYVLLTINEPSCPPLSRKSLLGHLSEHAEFNQDLKCKWHRDQTGNINKESASRKTKYVIYL